MQVLVTGGTGYIGSHACLELIRAGYEPVILDNLSNSQRAVIEQLKKICGKRPLFVQADVRDAQRLKALFAEYQFEAVLHFAGLKAVGESVERPVEYYDNNVGGTLALLKAMSTAGVSTLVFSSSATVYGDAPSPIVEDSPRCATNPYGRSKLIIEDILADLSSAEPGWRIARLRYFNPVGADESGLIGENPRGIPNNLLPYIAQVAVGRREFLSVFGDDYPTPDGTGIRDYLHVTDLARGHVAALRYLANHRGVLTVNLGTGRGHSVLEMVRGFERAIGRMIPWRAVARRPGDVARSYADPALAQRLLGWKAELDIDRMCADTWRWQGNFPNGLE